MRSVIARVVSRFCLPRKFEKWSYDQRFRYTQRLWREVDTTIKMALSVTLLFIVVIFLFSFTPVCDTDGECKKTGYSYFFTSSPNEVGDALAGIAGSLAFLWLITTVFLQGKELRLTRAEFTSMNAGQSKQSFDRFFFELISTHNQIVNAIKPNGKTVQTDVSGASVTRSPPEGRSAFETFVKFINGQYKGGKSEVEAYGQIQVSQDKLYEKHNGSLGHYFRFLYNSCRVIEDSSESSLKHKRLFRALLSDDELIIIFYNVLTPRGEKMVKYCDSFQLFDNLPIERLVAQSDWLLFEKVRDSILGGNELSLDSNPL